MAFHTTQLRAVQLQRHAAAFRRVVAKGVAVLAKQPDKAPGANCICAIVFYNMFRYHLFVSNLILYSI